MYKFIVITKDEIIKRLFIFIVTIILICGLYFFLIKDKPAFHSFYIDKTTDFTRDFDGDGVPDILSTEINNASYNIKIKTLNKDFFLRSKLYDINLLDKVNNCNIKIDFIDLSRDLIPEIIISGIKDNSPATYIFHWNNDNFEEFYFTDKNIVGLLDSQNTRTPIILNTISNKGDEATEGVIFNNHLPKDISASKPRIPSLATIQRFIDLIQLSYELSDTPDLFSPYIRSDELGLLWNLDKNKYRYSFQNSYFRDIAWNATGTPTSLLWILSFQKVDTLNSTIDPEELTLFVNVSIDQFGEYKINSITR